MDEWITVDQHQNISTKAKPDDYPKDRNWPEKMGAVCRKDPAFQGVEGFDGSCYICDHIVNPPKVKKASGRVWALACIREEVREDGRLVGFRDKTREVAKTDDKGQPTGETYTEKEIVVVNMGFKNFFSILQGFGGEYGTVLDRDFKIRRSGNDKDTTYSIIPMDPVPASDGNQLDLRNPEHMKRYETTLDLIEVISGRASTEFYARFFDPRVTVTESGGVQQTGASPEVQKPDNDADEDKLKAIADRVKGYGPEGGNGEATPAAEPAAASSGGMKDFG